MGEVGGGDESSFVVSFFWPGVWEIDVEAIDGFVGDEVGYEVGGVGSDEAYVCQVPSANTVDGVAVVFVSPFDTEEIVVGVCFGLVEEEGPFSGADFDVECGWTSENVGKIDSAIQIFGF